MGIEQDYDDMMDTGDTVCPKCGSRDVMEASFGKEVFLCADCGQMFGGGIQKHDDEDDNSEK